VQYEEECAAELTRANTEEQRYRLLLMPGAWWTIRDVGTDEPADVQIDDAYFTALSESPHEDACSRNGGHDGPSDTARTTTAMPNPRTTVVPSLLARMNVE
jgi:hypothetical protein